MRDIEGLQDELDEEVSDITCLVSPSLLLCALMNAWCDADAIQMRHAWPAGQVVLPVPRYIHPTRTSEVPVYDPGHKETNTSPLSP